MHAAYLSHLILNLINLSHEHPVVTATFSTFWWKDSGKAAECQLEGERAE